MRNQLFFLIAMLGLMASSVGLAAPPASLRIALAHSEEMSAVRSLHALAAELRATKISTELLLDGTAGGEAELLKQLIEGGGVEAGLVSATVLARAYPVFRLLTLPMLVGSFDQARAFPGSSQDRLLRSVMAKEKVVVLGYASFGFYGILGFNASSDTALPKQMRVRLPFDGWLDQVHRALSLRPIHVPMDSMEQGLGSGWIQALYSTPELLSKTALPLSAARFYKIRHLHGWAVLTASRDWYDQLSVGQQEALQQAATTFGQSALREAEQREETILSQWNAMAQPVVVTPAAPDIALAVAPLVLQQARELEEMFKRPQEIEALWRANNPTVPQQVADSRDELPMDLPGVPGGVLDLLKERPENVPDESSQNGLFTIQEPKAPTAPREPIMTEPGGPKTSAMPSVKDEPLQKFFREK